MLGKEFLGPMEVPAVGVKVENLFLYLDFVPGGLQMRLVTGMFISRKSNTHFYYSFSHWCWGGPCTCETTTFAFELYPALASLMVYRMRIQISEVQRGT